MQFGDMDENLPRYPAERDLKVIKENQAEAEAAAALAAPMEFEGDFEPTEIDADLVETPESRD